MDRGTRQRNLQNVKNWANEDERQEKFADYIRPRKNKRIARYCFKQRKQGATEGFDTFVKDLKLLLMDCQYADSDGMLIDAIIAGVRQAPVQERPDLAKTIEIPQSFEMPQK